jgi:hypothetical protein
MRDFSTVMLRQQSNYVCCNRSRNPMEDGRVAYRQSFSHWNRRMAKKTVLAIGIEPSFVDFDAFPGLTPELVRSYIEAQIERLRALGFEAEGCLIDLGGTAEAVVATALRSRRFDCVVIGAGLREPADRLLLFEGIINLVHALAPDARICFNTTPADTAEAVLRWVNP